MRLTTESRWIVSRFSAVTSEVNAALSSYRFDEAANAIYQFFWGEFCDWYLELAKLRLNFDVPQDHVTEGTLSALVTTFAASLKLLSPFMPFITEELWHALYAGIGEEAPGRSIALMDYPQPEDMPRDWVAENSVATLQELIVTVRAIRKEMGVPEKEAAPIAVYATDAAVIAVARKKADVLARMARVASVEIAPIPLTGQGARSTAQFDVQVIYERQIDVAAERERLTKDLAKYEKGLQAAERQLGNEAFMAKAPAHIVEGLRKQSAETKLLYDKTKASLDELPG
jgi:valyl-tRNA synthetase